MQWGEILAVAATLFFIMDPLGNIPVFNSLLARFDSQARARIVVRELLIALAILTLFLFAGGAILDFLSLSQSSLNISGGLLLFIIALRMIFPSAPAAHPQGDQPTVAEDPFIVPLAMPMVAGPSP